MINHFFANKILICKVSHMTAAVTGGGSLCVRVRAGAQRAGVNTARQALPRGTEAAAIE